MIIQLLHINVLSITCHRYEYSSKELDQHVILCNVMIVLLPSPSPNLYLVVIVRCNGSHVVYMLWFLNLNCVLSSFCSITAELRSKFCPLCSSSHILPVSVSYAWSRKLNADFGYIYCFSPF